MGKISKEQQDFLNNKMFEALLAGDWPRFELCVKKGADLQAKNHAGRNLLMVAIKNNMQSWLPYLLKNTPDLFLKDHEEKNAFFWAEQLAYSGDTRKITDMLLAALPDTDPAGADPAPKEEFNAAALKRDIPASKPVIIRLPPKKDGPFEL